MADPEPYDTNDVATNTSGGTSGKGVTKGTIWKSPTGATWIADGNGGWTPFQAAPKAPITFKDADLPGLLFGSDGNYYLPSYGGPVMASGNE